MATIEANDVEHWCHTFLAELNGDAPDKAIVGESKPTLKEDAWRSTTASAWTSTIGR